MENDNLMELVKKTTEITVKLDMFGKSMNALEERMVKLEALREQDIKQNEKIEQILTRLQTGSSHFEQIDKRLTALEGSDGKKAIRILTLIGTSILTIILSFVAAKVGIK